MIGRHALGALLAAASLAGAAPALAHALVKQSVPANGAVLTVAPKEVAITFNEKVEKLFSSATLKHASGASVATGKATVDPVNPAVLRLPVPALQAGQYVVQWNAVGSDGHRRSGELRFSVK